MIIVFTNRPTFSTLYSVRLPLLARGEGVQFSWTQASGFHTNEEVWQLDNIALLKNYEIHSALLSSFSGLEQSSSVMFYSGGNVEVVMLLLYQICDWLWETHHLLTKINM